MDYPAEVITDVSTPEYGKVDITTNRGRHYTADLRFFSKVYCFPKDPAQWVKVSIDSQGLALIWPTRFEVHVDQVVGLAE